MAMISHIGFATPRTFSGRFFERFRKNWVSDAVFILEDELLGPLVLHSEQRTHRVSTLQEFERGNLLVGVLQPRLHLGPALTEVMDERRNTRQFGTSTELVCEVVRRGGYPGAFGLSTKTSAQDLYAFLRRPLPIPRDAVRLFDSSSGGKTPSKLDP